MKGWRRIARFAGMSATIGPSSQNFNFSWRKRWIVEKVADVRIGEPRRHFSCRYRFLNRMCVRCRLIESHQWERHFAWSMAILAMFLKNGQDVTIEGWGGGARLWICSGRLQEERCDAGYRKGQGAFRIHRWIIPPKTTPRRVARMAIRSSAGSSGSRGCAILHNPRRGGEFE